MVRQFLTASAPKSSKPSFVRKPLFAEQLEPREVPSTGGLEDIYSMPSIPGNRYPTDIQPPSGQPGQSLLGTDRSRYVVGSDGTGVAQVNVYDAKTNALLGIINPFGTNYKGSIAVATGDVTGDGIEDIIVAAGRGSQPIVKVYDGSTLVQRVSFLAYSQTFHGGVTVAVGDITGDGRADIVVGAGIGSAPQIKAFSGVELFALPGSIGNANPRAVRNFFAFGTSNRAGVTVAVGDVDGDRHADIVVGTGAGVAGQVRAFNGLTGAKIADFAVGDASNKTGVNVAAGDITGDGKAEIIAGQATVGSLVRIYHKDGSQVASYAAFPTSKGVRVATEDINGDGKSEVVVSVANGTPRVRVLNGTTGAILRDFPGFVPSYTGGLVVG